MDDRKQEDSGPLRLNWDICGKMEKMVVPIGWQAKARRTDYWQYVVIPNRLKLEAAAAQSASMVVCLSIYHSDVL